ncbi:MAG: type II CAAX prenyl endopeptidase Rce1 family protein [Promethearchaeota archaeon]
MPIIKEDENRNLLLFLLITFLFSWILWLPSLLASIGLLEPLLIYGLLRIVGSFGPFVAAFTLTYINDKAEGIRILWTRGWHYGNWRFLIISIFLLPILKGLSLFLAVFTEGSQFPELRILEDYTFIIVDFIFFFFIAGPFQEEYGWRGYALDRFQSQWNALESSLLLGTIWSVWHFPLFFITGTPQANTSFFSFLFTVIILSVLFTWLYNNTHGSILVVMIFHATNNISNSIFPLNTTILGDIYYAFLLDLVVVFVLIIYGPKRLSRKSIDEFKFVKFKI